MTRDTLLSGAQERTGLVFIVAPSLTSPTPYYGGPTLPSLGIDERALYDQLCEGAASPPLVIFVTQRIPAALLYEKYLDKVPPFYLLSDYADPCLVSIAPRENARFVPHFISPPVGVETKGTLSSALLVKPNETVIFAFDHNGKLVFSKSTNEAPLHEIAHEVRQILTR